VERYRSWFKLFWLRGDAAFASPEIYEYCDLIQGFCVKCSFIFISQSGELEIKSILLAASLRRNLSCKYEMIVAFPTPEERWGKLKEETVLFLRKIGARLVPFVNLIDEDYPIGNKVSCLILDVTGDIKIFLDSDILCLRPFKPPREFNARFCAKPADLMTFTKQHEIWKKVYDSLGVQMPKDRMEATVSKEIMPPYFNTGFIAVHSNVELGQTWLDFCRCIDSNPNILNKRPWLDQIALPVAVSYLGIDYACLDEQFNYPAHIKPLDKDNLPFFVHYHGPEVISRERELRRMVKELAREYKEIRNALSGHHTWNMLLLSSSLQYMIRKYTSCINVFKKTLKLLSNRVSGRANPR